MASKTRPKWANAWGFFAATYAGAWLIWLPAILLRGAQPSLLFLILGAFVPTVMGILFTYVTNDRAGWKDFWTRVVDLRRIGWRWLAVILLVFPTVHAVTYLLCPLLGVAQPSLNGAGAVLVNPGLMLQLILANLIISGFSEELGWRGYALDRLQRSWSALGASMVLGLVHSLWHMPLFFIPGITQGEMGLFSVGALVFLAGGPAGAVVFTWVFNNTRKSILSAILVHFMMNLCLDLLVGLQGALPTGYTAVFVGTLIILDSFIVAVWGAKTMTGRRRPAVSRGASEA